MVVIVDEQAERPASFGEVLAVGQFRVLWIAHAQSRLGDQLGRLAIAILVFDRTGSAALTALTYALSFLPPLVSAPLLTPLADRYSRRLILVATDLARGALVAVMAIPGLPLGVLAVLLVVMVSLQPLYSAARNAILPNVLAGDRYMVGVGLVQGTDNIVQIAGFAAGGVLVGLIGSHAALGVDAVTFAVSATLAALGLTAHHPARQPDQPDTTTVPDSPDTPRARGALLLQGAKLIWGDPRLRSLAALLWLYGFYVAPEGLAAPYAHQLGAGTAAVGLLMAADPIGAGIGSLAISRLVAPARRTRLIGVLAAAAGLPLIASALQPSLWLAVALWALSGVLSSHTVVAFATFTRLVPDHRRGQAVGLVSAGLQTAQGLGLAAAGAVASVLSPSVTVAVCGAAGTVCALLAGRAWQRARTST